MQNLSWLPDDKNLPNVPPLQLSVPADYPDQSPLWVDNPQQYGTSERGGGWVGLAYIQNATISAFGWPVIFGRLLERWGRGEVQLPGKVHERCAERYGW